MARAPRAAVCHHPVRPMHGRGGQSGHSRTFCCLSHSERLRPSLTRSHWGTHQNHRIASEQSQILAPGRATTDAGPSRSGPPRNRGTGRATWSCSQNGKRGPRERFWHQRRGRGRHPRLAAFDAIWLDHRNHTLGYRKRSHGTVSSGTVVHAEPPHDFSWSPGLQGSTWDLPWRFNLSPILFGGSVRRMIACPVNLRFVL